jgi:uncharacterized protein YbbC (DUF1343 family)/CubicO group peptidase (beta-lactamase class C family)
MMKALCTGLLLVSAILWAQTSPAPNGPEQFPEIDAIIDDAVQTNLIPGAVLAIGHDGKVVYRKAYGSRSLIPNREPMTLDTIFDAASLTKVVATTPSIMKLFEQGKIRINDPVTKYLPEFQGGKSDITIRHLMTHFSGLPPDLILIPRWSGYEVGIRKALTVTPVAPPGARFIYSDINFNLLAEIIRRLSGKSVADFAHEQIYQPLHMDETRFLPPADWKPRIAPTEVDTDTGQPMRGIVDDPTARFMGGVAGDAGLFTTADDLAKYAGMLLGKGTLNGVRIFTPATVRKFTEPASPADQPILRGLGFDIDSAFSSNRGELYPVGSFGHTGYTGTSLWMDPVSNSFVIVLTNVVHPIHGNSLSSFRSRVATVVAERYGATVPGAVALTGYEETMIGAHRTIDRNGQTLTGLDVLEQQHFGELKGKRVGLITNHTGIDRQGNRNVVQMMTGGVEVVKLFSPEHGITGALDVSSIANSKDKKTGLPVVSLYRPEERHLSAEQMQGTDALVFDIQDVGARFYTYSCTMLYALEAAAKAHKPFYLLDRPNPITGTRVEGPVLDNDLQSFVGCLDIPLRHGMTFGELATMANAEKHWNADLHVVKMSNWQRGDWFDATGLIWVNPSPNMRSLNAALLYPGIAMIEADHNYSVGRGTDAPFEQVGADWIDGPALARALNARYIPGVRIYPTRFRPSESNFAGKEIQGVRFVITNREAFDSTRLGIELVVALQKLYPKKLDLTKCRFLIGNHKVIEALQKADDPGAITGEAQQEAIEFDARRKAYLLY